MAQVFFLMANEFKYDQWNIDTQTTDPAKVTAAFTKVRSIKWISPSASAGDLCEITDGAGFTLWKAVASGSNFEVEAFVERTWKSGFAVPDLDSGTLHIVTRTVR